jgi:lysozyme
VNVDSLLATLRADEGWRQFAYDDSEGFVTIGYGFLVDSRKGVGLPKPVAEYWLRYAVNERLAELRKLWPAFDDQPEDVQQAIGNMAYQLGPAGVMKFKRMLSALDAHDRVTAADEMLESKWAEQTPSRARRVAAMVRGLPT